MPAGTSCYLQACSTVRTNKGTNIIACLVGTLCVKWFIKVGYIYWGQDSVYPNFIKPNE